jgi:hypothetical protein
MGDIVEITETVAAIERDVVQLQQTMEILHENVQIQQASFDTIEDVIHQSQRQVEWSQQDIVAAENNLWYYHNLVTPILLGIVTAATGFFYGVF